MIRIALCWISHCSWAGLSQGVLTPGPCTAPSLHSGLRQPTGEQVEESQDVAETIMLSLKWQVHVGGPQNTSQPFGMCSF